MSAYPVPAPAPARPRAASLWLTLVLGLAATSAADARALGAQAVVLGRVVADSGGAPLPAAEISVAALGRSVRSDAMGGFRLGDVPAGVHTLVVRHVGFRQLELAVALADGDSLEVDVALSTSAQSLPTVAVAAGGPASRKLAGFEERRARGFGAFLTREEIVQRDEPRLSQLLRRLLPGIRLAPLPTGGFAILGGRFSGTLERASPRDCHMTVYVDGVRLVPLGQSDPMTDMDERRDGPNIDNFLPGEIAAIEVYRGPAETPPEFLGSTSACGVFVIWTQDG